MQYIERRDSSANNVIHDSKGVVRRKGFIALRRLSTMLWVSAIVFLFSPLFGFMALFYTMVVFYRDIYLVFFHNKKVFKKYYSFFGPMVDATSLSVIGYRVEWDDLEEHLSLINDGTDKEINKKMAEKQKVMMQKNNKSKWVGLGLNTLLTHIIVSGKTGAGKTEGLRSLANNSMENGCGIGFNDGKSEMKMLYEIATQAKENNRETSFRALNFLKGEHMAETNTLNPISMLHPFQAIEFLGSLVEKDGGGGGNQEYFFNRGKVMLSCGLNALYGRKEIANEPFDFDKLMDTRNIKALAVFQILYYCMCRDIDNMIAENKEVSNKLKSFRSVFGEPSLKNLQMLVDYITQNPNERKNIEEELNCSYIVIKETYVNTYLLIGRYLDGVWNPYSKYLDVIDKFIYAKAKLDGKVFFTNKERESIMGFEQFKNDYYEATKAGIESEEIKDILIKVGRSKEEFYFDLGRDYSVLKEGLARPKAQGGNIENIPEDALQQHQYASQQWDSLSNIFANFKHVFGQSRGELDPSRLFLDNQILYVLIPVLELSDDYVQILGRMIVMLIKQLAATALGGQNISVHKTINNITQDKLKPKPFTLEVLDEYGSYPIPGVDKLIFQLRSLKVCLAFGIQNNDALKVGSDDKAIKGILANATKWLTKTEDSEELKWIKEMMGEETFLTNELQTDAMDDLVNSTSTKIETKMTMPIEKIRDFSRGFSVILSGSSKERNVLMQSFYRGGKVDTIHLKKFSPLSF